jgi:hypothetical protein
LEWGLKWLDQYAQAGNDLNAYMALFNVPAGKLAGDMSPNFCRLGAIEVQDIRKKLGDIPVFLLIRDPIERDWSHAQLMLQHHKSRVQQSDDAYIEYIFTPRCQSYSNYLRMIDIWGGLFSKFSVFYLDDIAERPQHVMKKICEFLNIADDAPKFKIDELAPNPSVKLGKFVRTPAIYEAQKRISEPLMAELKARLGGHAAAWYDRHFGGAPMPLEASATADVRQG